MHRTLVRVGLGLGVLFVLFLVLGRGRVDDQRELPSRALLNRPWLDRLPERESQSRILWIWSRGGVALFLEGSEWRGRFDYAEFERNDRSLRGTWLHDKKRFKTRFRVERCADAPAPFDLCLTFGRAPKGPKRLYSWGSVDEARRFLEDHAPSVLGRLEDGPSSQ